MYDYDIIISKLDSSDDIISHAVSGPWNIHGYGTIGDDIPACLMLHQNEFDWNSITYESEFIASSPAYELEDYQNFEFISHARDELSQRNDAIRAVLGIHLPTSVHVNTVFSSDEIDDSGRVKVCRECFDSAEETIGRWPCNTFQAIQEVV